MTLTINGDIIKVSDMDIQYFVRGGVNVLENIQIMGRITLKELRNLTGLSQQEFANKVDIPFTTYRRYEKDVSKMEVGKLFQICDIFGVSVSNIKI